MSFPKVTLLLALASMFTVACSSDDSGSSKGSNVSRSQHDEICDRMGTHLEECGEKDTADAVAKCKKAYDCAPAFRPGVISNVFECKATSPCDSKGDSCFGKEYEKYKDNAVYKTFNTACQAKVKECQMGDDNCFLDMATDELLEAWTKCLDKSCDELKSCIRQEVESRAPGCEMF